jgi:hypothetical protein
MDDQIKYIVKELRAVKRAKKYLAEIQQVRSEQVRRMKVVEAEIRRELHVIDKLNRNSLLSLLKNLQGRKTEILDIRKQHYLNLALEFNELQKSVARFDFEMEVLERKIEKQEALTASLLGSLRARDTALDSPDLQELRQVVHEIDHKLMLQKELEEAIAEGGRLSRLFTAALHFVKNNSHQVYKVSRSVQKLTHLNSATIEKYQDHMIRIQHSMVKFEAEVNDVYNSIMKFRIENQSIASHFLTEYRMNLINDIHNYMDLASSTTFLKYHKSVVANFLRLLRNDLKTVKRDLQKLEAQEQSFIESL